MYGTVVVGIGAVEQDAETLTWAADQAWCSRDALYVVHAYRTLVSADRYWPPLVHANDARRASAQHVVASAAQLARARRPGLSVDGSSIAGRVNSVLLDMSQVARLLVVGRHAGTTPSELRPLGAGAACPVVFVGPQPCADGPVVLLLDDGGPTDGCAAAVEFAFAAAEQRHVGLVAIQAGMPESAEPPTCTAALATQTERQEQLDLALAGWQRQFPEVSVVAELRREPGSAMRQVTSAGQLVVLAQGSTDSFASAKCLPHQAAIAVVPSTTHTASTTQRSSPCSTSHPGNPAVSSPSHPATRTSSVANGSLRRRANTGPI